MFEKKIFFKKIISTIFLITSLSIFSQKPDNFNSPIYDTFLLLSGKKLILNDYLLDKNKGYLYFKKKKNKVDSIHLDMIFSMVNYKGEETIFYESMLIDNFIITQEQMKNLIKGSYLAYKDIKPFFILSTGFLVGLSSFYSSIFFFGTPFYSLILPCTYTFFKSIPISEKKIKLKYPNSNNFFIIGYTETLIEEKIRYSIIGNSIGIITGILSVFIISQISK